MRPVEHDVLMVTPDGDQTWMGAFGDREQAERYADELAQVEAPAQVTYEVWLGRTPVYVARKEPVPQKWGSALAIEQRFHDAGDVLRD